MGATHRRPHPVVITEHDGGAAALLATTLPPRAVGLAWLGQAGFLLRSRALRLLIDPYLSDHLAAKYAGTEFPHVRMMPPPIAAGDLRDLDWVLCTHRHSDHMDPGSLATIAASNPRCRFVVPRAEIASALKVGLPRDRLVPVTDGDRVALPGAGEILAIPAAHERLTVDADGDQHFLGYVVRLGDAVLYHSGDCLVYDGQAERLGAAGVDVALLPVNGRTPYLTAKGILGNMDFDEAVALCRAAGIPRLIPHHFGMFAFNTADPADLQGRCAALDGTALDATLPRVDRHLLLA